MKLEIIEPIFNYCACCGTQDYTLYKVGVGDLIICYDCIKKIHHELEIKETVTDLNNNF